MHKDKESSEEFFEKYSNFISYVDRIKTSNNITKGHKQRFINIVIEFLKFKEKDVYIKLFIYYLLYSYKKEINKYKKCVDEPVAKKLEQLMSEFYSPSNINNLIDMLSIQNIANMFNNNKNKNNLINNNNTDYNELLLLLSKEENINKFNNNIINNNQINNNKDDINKIISEINNYQNNENINYLNLNNNNNYINEIKNDDDNLNKNKVNINTDISTNINNNNNGDSKLKKKINQMINKINNYSSVKEYILNSINKEHKNNKIFCDTYQFSSNNLLEKESEITKEKILILICLIFPFISNKQKLQLLSIEKQFNENYINYLKNSKLFNKSKNNNISEFLVQSIINKEINKELIPKIFLKNLFLTKTDIFELYQVYIISEIFNFNSCKDFLYKISFKIKFILKNYNQLYENRIGINFDTVLLILYRIKNFYTFIYQNKLIFNENEMINYFNIFNEYNNLNNGYEIIQKNNINDIDNILFTEEENNAYNELIKRINIFYKINNKIDIITGYTKELKNYEFTFNIIELINFKNDFILNNFQTFQNNLINIEKYIYTLGRKSLFIHNLYNLPKSIIFNYSINPYLKNIFYTLDFFLHEKLYMYEFKLYPYGSITEFLSDQESDIDLFLDISLMETNQQKISFLYGLVHWIKYFDKNVNSTISTRVCVISFKFKKISFDISIVGFCPYLHSYLIREYSLIDPRFPLLVIAIKNIIKELKINNISEDKNHLFLNSFSWVLLLIAFLQDIVQPPVLPKILTNSEIFIKKVFFGNNKIEKEEKEESFDKNNNKDKGSEINSDYIYTGDDKGYDINKNKITKNKNFESFVNNMEIDDIKIPGKLGNKNFRTKNYNNQIIHKNNMTCSELLLKFLEFVIFYFKYDSIFVNCSFSYEGFQNMKQIDNIINSNNNEDKIFMNYFNSKYIKKNYKGEKNKDGYFLIRDPFDPRYNPGQTLKSSSLKKFFSRLKLVYYNLVKYGNLSLIKEQVEIEDKIKK